MVRIQNFLGFGVASIALITASQVTQVTPAQANDYQDCTQDLLTDAKLDRAVAAKSCAEALHPKHVGSCVKNLIGQTIEGTSAVDACRRVRRPLELPICVSDIRNASETALDGAVLAAVLDACRKSLLPNRFGQCVSGLRRGPLALPVGEGLATCLDATDYRKDIKLYPVPTIAVPTMTETVCPACTPVPGVPTTPKSSDPIPQTY